MAYGKPAVLISVTPKSGKNVKGSKAVTATGTASVAHQAAISIVTEATTQPDSLNPGGGGNRLQIKNNKRPTQKPFFL